MTSIRTLIVDNNKVFRANLKKFLSTEPAIQIIGESQSGDEAIDQVNALSPDLVLMDLKMGETDGIKATRIIKSQNPGVLVIILTIYDEDLYRSQAAEAKAAAYILKEEIPDKLLQIIRDNLPGAKVRG
ncbi:MAG: response regulator transcription factor [Actinobacteria bacterium]|nr:response regulator transcription factor [Actinomycetota bacterium]